MQVYRTFYNEDDNTDYTSKNNDSKHRSQRNYFSNTGPLETKTYYFGRQPLNPSFPPQGRYRVYRPERDIGLAKTQPPAKAQTKGGYWPNNRIRAERAEDKYTFDYPEHLHLYPPAVGEPFNFSKIMRELTANPTGKALDPSLITHFEPDPVDSWNGPQLSFETGVHEIAARRAQHKKFLWPLQRRFPKRGTSSKKVGAPYSRGGGGGGQGLSDLFSGGLKKQKPLRRPVDNNFMRTL